MKRLVEFAEREELLESSTKGYETRNLNWIIKLNLAGEFKGLIKMDKNTKHSVPYKGRSGQNLPPLLLYDKPDFVLGRVPDPTKPKIVTRTKTRHQAFCRLVSKCAEDTGEPSVQAVHRFLQSENLSDHIHDEMKEGEWITFQIEETDEKPIDLPSVQEFWAKVNSKKDEGQKNYQCVICGEECDPVTPHKTDIVLPVKGGDRAKIISADKSAFYSYGLEKSLIAPTCELCEEKYGRATVSLLHLEKYSNNRMSIGNLVYLFWTKQKGAPIFMPIEQPDTMDVRKLRQKVFSGGTINVNYLQTSNFYGLALSPNKARIVVRDWEETTLESVYENVYRFLHRQRVGRDEKYYGIYALAASLFRDANKEMTENVPKLLLKHAMFGKRLPESILYQAVNRCRSEKKVTRIRAGIMRLCLTQNLRDLEEGWLMVLEENLHDVGYLCGRLFAVLEKIQNDASSGKTSSEGKSSINTTVTDKFYGTASTAPASVFGMLMRNAQSHLSKLRKEKRGWAVNHSRLLGEIAQKIELYPNILTLKQQSMFSLGYLHQRDDFYKTKSSKEEK